VSALNILVYLFSPLLTYSNFKPPKNKIISFRNIVTTNGSSKMDGNTWKFRKNWARYWTLHERNTFRKSKI